jgi:hypothetical protein
MKSLKINTTKPLKNRKGLTAFITDNNTLAFQLYNTVILTMNDKYISLNTAGWKTNHSKKCMNDNLPTGYRVFQKNFDWFVETPKGIINFSDEMVIER